MAIQALIEKINPKTKVIITRGPLERWVIDCWKLDQNLKEISRYTFVIDMIDHFSKFKPIKKNNIAYIENLKTYFNTIGYPKIIQSGQWVRV